MGKYFTSNDVSNLVYYQVPKILVIGEKYKEMNPNAMKLYIVLIDRIKLSMSHNWKDSEGRYYVRMSIEKGSELLGFSDSTFKRAKKELTKFELLEEKREGKNKTNVLYPLQLEFTDEDVYKINREVDDMLEGAEKEAQDQETRWIVQNELSVKERIGQKELSRMGQNELSWIGQNDLLDGSKRTTNKNNIINNEINKNKINNNILEEEEKKTFNHKKLKFQSEFSSSEINEAKNFIAPQMNETFNELNLSSDFKERIMCYMNMAGVKYISATEIRNKNVEIEKEKKDVMDRAFYLVKGILLKRTTSNADQVSYLTEKSKKKPKEKVIEESTTSVPFYNWLEQ